MTTKTPHRPGGTLLAAGIAAFLVAAILLHCATGCAPLTPAGKAALSAAEPAILALDAWACSETALIPVVGAAVEASACPGEEALVRNAIDKAVAVAPPTATSAAPQVVTRAASPGRRVCIGRIGKRTSPTLDGGAEGGGR